MEYTLNIKGRLVDLSEPKVMGIVNVTPDSFYAGSRMQTEEEIGARCYQHLAEGAAMIDVGAYSTRPGASLVSEEEETARLRQGLNVVRRILPDAIISIDTFRPGVARMAIEEYGADIINDVQGSEEMFRLVARMGVPYILMSREATMHDMLTSFARQVQQLRDMGQKDIILDPGFGFGKTLEQNYEVMNRLEELTVFELPILVGVSRKSMVYRLLETSPERSLNGTTALHTLALTKGASVLRVHDVRAAVECIKIVTTTHQ
jgi:dihydropteroate synthase